MDIRQSELTNEQQYFLDGAVDAFEITPSVWMALNLYGDAARIAPILDYGEHRLTRRRVAAFGLCRYAEELMPGIPDMHRRAILANGTLFLRGKVLDDAIQVCAGWAYEDARKGGCLLPFRKRWRCNEDGLPTKALARRLHSPSFIRSYVKHDDFITETACVSRHHLTMVARWPSDASEADRLAVDTAFKDQFAANRRRRELAYMTREQPNLDRRDRRRRHKIVRRSALFAATLLGAATVSAFARGEPVTLPGDELALRVQRAGTLIACGHGALAVELLDRGGVSLAHLCVYQDAPAFDQLAGFALHMSSGLERELVATANITRHTEAGAAHPILKERITDRAARFAQWVDDPIPFMSSHALEQLLQRRYREQTYPFWRDAIAVRMFGRRWKEFI